MDLGEPPSASDVQTWRIQLISLEENTEWCCVEWRAPPPAVSASNLRT